MPRVDSRPLQRIETSSDPHRSRGNAESYSEEARRVGLRTLLITATVDSPSYQASRAALERMALPFDVLVAKDEQLALNRLYSGDGDCLYSGVILDNGDLGYFDDEGAWVSAFDAAEWERLASYERGCGVREAIWYAFPGPQYGLAFEGSFDTSVEQSASLTSAGSELFDYLNPELDVAVQHVYGYYGTILDTERTSPILENHEGKTLGVIHRRPDETETLVFTLDSGTFSLHSQLVEFGVLNWLHRGLFLGKRRVYLAPQIDDVFLATEMYSPDGIERDFRIGSADVQATLDWQREFQARLPEGSDYVTYMAFNGAGTQDDFFYDQSMVQSFLEVQAEFDWISHTWDHENMDAMPIDVAMAEIQNNCQLGANLGLEGFSCDDVVTPQISGLDNLMAINGLLGAGVRYVVSDTSITEAINPENPHTNPSHNVGRRNPWNPELFMVPRYPTNIFYNCSTVDEEVGLYNQIYESFHGRELDYEEILESDTALALSYMMAYDANPLMFHQANLFFFEDAQGELHSLFSDWMDRLIDRYLELTRLPVLSLNISELAELMLEREAYERCGVRATLVEERGRRRIELESVGACTVPITGIYEESAGRVEDYAGIPTTHVELDACGSATIPLSSP